MLKTLLRRPVVSWALYDWANSAFATTVMAVFFPILFKSYWDSASDPTVSTFHLGLANTLASLVVAILAPIAHGDGHEHVASGRELHGVSDQVGQNLPKPGRIARERARNVRVDQVRQVEPLLGRPRAEHLERRLDAVLDVEGNLLDAQQEID